jgi:hypothetical protein
VRENVMTAPVPDNHALRHLFDGLVEHTLYVDLGICDPLLARYLADLLVDFLHTDQIFALRDAAGRRIDQVAEMISDAVVDDDLNAAERTRLVHKHIGDFTLFWTGVYPEGLRRLRRGDRKDCLIDYVEQGRHSYAIAYDLTGFDAEPPARVLRRLSVNFETCAHGLALVRRGWEQGPASAADFPPLAG